MEAQYKCRNGHLTLKVTGETQKDLFRELARAQDVFEAEQACGICQGTEISFRVRGVEDNEYFELQCACGARFQFGQHRKGGSLFPKRRNESGPLPNGGWSKWEPTEGERR